MTVKTLFPVTRIHEPIRVEVDVQGGRVVDAWIGACLFRGVELMLTGRDVRDAPLFVQRICGICSSAHAVAAAQALASACRVQPTPAGQYLINLLMAADFLQNHLRHFYLLVLPDYVTGPDSAPFFPRTKGDFRLPKKLNDELFGHVRPALDLAARAHEMMALFGAKAPHQQTIMPTGVTERANAERLMAYGAILQEIKEWVEKVYLADVLTIAEYYQDYFTIGRGYGHFLSYGGFPEPGTGQPAFPVGLVENGGLPQPLDLTRITEHIHHGWYQDDQESRHPIEGRTAAAPDKSAAYSWCKAPRYGRLPAETGPLARAWISGEYRRGISVMDRLIARAREALKICRLAQEWLARIAPGAPTLAPYTLPPRGEGVGLLEAMRGALGHWLRFEEGKISHYQIVTPTAWNFSPRDNLGQRGPVEEALIGTPIAAPESLIEVGRVIRSFDPCFTCAAHLISAPLRQHLRQAGCIPDRRPAGKILTDLGGFPQ
ncbi:nickel-dependent hydrogenase, large subunit [Thermosinus carboxydivorans Nor1]|uniref:Nickel-dependent hydrogenase, large subunit n=1 Tax=Thermosinus carboxydivorans Nor1 TaxID=401526 RepID=A1HNH4_9FIRM|nr:nickel-dependent hydrogenase large subunit [Thermosinus carboxydivorans]EAX48333.1 nickel-dependent hydrogenase, large subunit [Thermosinus carboxydivorans Nor1]